MLRSLVMMVCKAAIGKLSSLSIIHMFISLSEFYKSRKCTTFSSIRLIDNRRIGNGFHIFTDLEVFTIEQISLSITESALLLIVHSADQSGILLRSLRWASSLLTKPLSKTVFVCALTPPPSWSQQSDLWNQPAEYRMPLWFKKSFLEVKLWTVILMSRMALIISYLSLWWGGVALMDVITMTGFAISAIFIASSSEGSKICQQRQQRFRYRIRIRKEFARPFDNLRRTSGIDFSFTMMKKRRWLHWWHLLTLLPRYRPWPNDSSDGIGRRR